MKRRDLTKDKVLTPADIVVDHPLGSFVEEIVLVFLESDTYMVLFPVIREIR